MALGADRAVMFGSCGVLDKTIPDGAVIVPYRAYRDEGISFHYAPSSEYMWRRTRIYLTRRVRYSARTACRLKWARSGQRMRFIVKRRAGCTSSVKRLSYSRNGVRCAVCRDTVPLFILSRFYTAS